MVAANETEMGNEAFSFDTTHSNDAEKQNESAANSAICAHIRTKPTVLSDVNEVLKIKLTISATV